MKNSVPNIAKVQDEKYYEITSLTSSYFKEVDEIECAILKIEVKASTLPPDSVSTEQN